MVSGEKVREAAERAGFRLPLINARAVETMLAWQLNDSSGFRQFTKADGAIRIWIRNDVAQPAHILSCDQKKDIGLDRDAITSTARLQIQTALLPLHNLVKAWYRFLQI